MESSEKLKKYSLEYCSDSNYQELLETAKTISEDVEGNLQFKFPVEVCKKKKSQLSITIRMSHHKIRKIGFYKCFFLYNLDILVALLNERFEQLVFLQNTFRVFNFFLKY